MSDDICNYSRSEPRLRKGGLFADFTIRCQDRVFKVHRVELCATSDYFRVSCEPDKFKEGTEREINLDDEDPTDIKMMLDFVYEKAYCVDNTGEEDAYGYEQNESDASHASTTAKCPSRRVSDTATSSLASPGESAIPSSVHFRLFLLGDKYMMPQLKSYAGTQFYLDLEGLEPDAYIKLIKAMYPIPDIEGIDKLKKMMLRQVCY